MIRAFLLCCILFLATVCVRQARADVDEYEEDLRSTSWSSDNDKSVVTYAKVLNRADYPGDELLRHVRVEWRDIEVDLPHWRSLKVRGRLLVDDGGKVRPVDWFQGISVLLNVGPEPRPDWSNGFDADVTAGNQVLLRPDGTFTVAIALSQAPRIAGKERQCQAGVVLGKADGRRMIYKFGGIPLAGSITTLTLPPAPELDSELEVINAAAPWPHRCSDPTALIRAVNELHALGKQQALDALRRYVELAPDGRFFNDELPFDAANIDQGDYNVAFWIIRLLFEPAQAGTRIPQPALGAAVPSPAESDKTLWPLFPIEVVDDIPFMIAQGWNLGGVPERPSSHIKWAERYGVLRDAPLRPADDPLAAAERLLSLPKTQRLKLRGEPIWTQAWQFVADLFPSIKPDALHFNQLTPEQWNTLCKAAADEKIHWNENKQAYVLGRLRN